MDKTLNDEKFLINPLDTPELPPSGETTPLLTTKEFIKTTPSHELKNVFGQSLEEIIAPTWAPPPPIAKSEETAREFKNLQKNFLNVFKKETAKSNPSPLPTPKAGLVKKIFRIVITLFLIVFILMVALYIWGALLQK